MTSVESQFICASNDLFSPDLKPINKLLQFEQMKNGTLNKSCTEQETEF